MNRQLSTCISGKHQPENVQGEHRQARVRPVSLPRAQPSFLGLQSWGFFCGTRFARGAPPLGQADAHLSKSTGQRANSTILWFSI